MSLALRFAEEGSFRCVLSSLWSLCKASTNLPPICSSRACDVSLSESPDVAPSKAFFRWSRTVRQKLGSSVNEPVKIHTLIVATPGPAQQFVQQLTTTWTRVGTLLTSDQSILPCKLSEDAPATAVLLSKKGINVSEEGNTLALLVGSEIPVEAAWSWLSKLTQHINAQDVVCLDSQLSTVYADEYAEVGARLRLLASSSVPEQGKAETPVRPLEVPQFLTGIPAALLTHGELRRRSVRVFVSLRDVSTTSVDVMRSFLPLSASVLEALERPMFFQPKETKHGDSSLNVLYT
ncbi:hypothetical protein P3T76_005995 [Phytophthora citrophthora]|uniref:Proteasome assembly chaperone 1 n=1 Tax=Phytophthora citrophthora TaxID=4793 RepID=A0AAD9GQW5_9STRA|nr:hypothetical protein P3T76_005995 [Phytophthora citrophthora]